MDLKLLHLSAIILSAVGVIELYRTIGAVRREYRLSYVLLSIGILSIITVNIGIDYWIEFLNPGPGLVETLHLISDSALLAGGACFAVGVLHLVRKVFPSRQATEKSEEFLNALLRQDMNNKLGTSTGFLQLIEESDLSEEDANYLRKAIKINKEGSDLVNLVRQVRKAEEAGELRPMNLGEVLEGAIEESEKLARGRGAIVELDLPERETKVLGGPSLKNLFSTLVRTRVRKAGCNRMIVSVGGNNEVAVVRIEDDGQRIPDASKEKIMTGTYTGETSGLGGPIYFAAKTIAESHGGGLEVRDSELGGARFDVHLQKA